MYVCVCIYICIYVYIHTHTHTHTYPWGGHGNPLQYSCLENPMYRGAWQATVHEVARVRHNLATKPPPYICLNEITTKYWLFCLMLLRMIFTCFLLTNLEYFCNLSSDLQRWNNDFKSPKVTSYFLKYFHNYSLNIYNHLNWISTNISKAIDLNFWYKVSRFFSLSFPEM